ncbi:hypothetical protein BRPE64_BCDS06160 [Caballeronia insecticola]|uniref:Uncharacterized protein n=1 Tax=Caballeronia insecticola TaxID=758793 RepID=R4X1Z2_9BURK|nr:hypothetical protein BRPE64_BCDS06160 [Caballeronia insecticola]
MGGNGSVEDHRGELRWTVDVEKRTARRCFHAARIAVNSQCYGVPGFFQSVLI